MSFKLSIGKCSIVDSDIFTNEAIVAMDRRPGLSDPRWLYHAIPRIAKSVIPESAVKGATLNLHTLNLLGVLTPPVGEQRRIAEILDSIDELIEKDRAISRKLMSVRAGVVADALARSDQEEIVSLGSVLDRIDAGVSPLAEDRLPQGSEWGVLRVSAVSSGVFISDEVKALPSARGRPDIEVHAGDLLMARANGVAELVGTVALVDAPTTRIMLSDKTLRLVPTSRTSSEYLSVALSSDFVRSQVKSLINGTSGQNNISQRMINSLLVPVPEIDQQHSIVFVVSSIRDEIRSKQRQVAKLRALKEGLAADLLSGRVRVAEVA